MSNSRRTCDYERLRIDSFDHRQIIGATQRDEKGQETALTGQNFRMTGRLMDGSFDLAR